MRGIDTNILVRFITKDDLKQYKLAKQFLLTECSKSHPGYICSVVLAELAWVLKKVYEADRGSLTTIIKQLLRIEQLEVAERDAVVRALVHFQNSKTDFADCLMGELNHLAGCQTTLTLDKTASKLNTFELLR